MSAVTVTVVNAISASLLLPETCFEPAHLVPRLLALFGHRPSRPVMLMHDGVVIDNSFQAVAGASLALTAVLGRAVPDEERSELLQRLEEAEPSDLEEVFEEFSEAARDDEAIVFKAVERWPGCLAHASALCRDNRIIVLKAVERLPGCLMHAGASCRNDREIVLKAVEKDPECLIHAGERCRDDHDIVLMAVTRSPCCLKLAGETCKNDRDIVLRAVEKDPSCLRYAGASRRFDPVIVGLVVPLQPCCLNYAKAEARFDASRRCLWRVKSCLTRIL